MIIPWCEYYGFPFLRGLLRALFNPDSGRRDGIRKRKREKIKNLDQHGKCMSRAPNSTECPTLFSSPARWVVALGVRMRCLHMGLPSKPQNWITGLLDVGEGWTKQILIVVDWNDRCTPWTVVILYNVYICTFIARQQATREKQNSECYCKERIMDNLGAGWFPHQDGSQARLLCASFSQAQPLPPPVLVSANNGVTGQLTVIHTYVVWRSASGAWAHQWSDRATDLDWSTAWRAIGLCDRTPSFHMWQVDRSEMRFGDPSSRQYKVCGRRAHNILIPPLIMDMDTDWCLTCNKRVVCYSLFYLLQISHSFPRTAVTFTAHSSANLVQDPQTTILAHALHLVRTLASIQRTQWKRNSMRRTWLMIKTAGCTASRPSPKPIGRAVVLLESAPGLQRYHLEPIQRNRDWFLCHSMTLLPPPPALSALSIEPQTSYGQFAPCHLLSPWQNQNYPLPLPHGLSSISRSTSIPSLTPHGAHQEPSPQRTLSPRPPPPTPCLSRLSLEDPFPPSPTLVRATLPHALDSALHSFPLDPLLPPRFMTATLCSPEGCPLPPEFYLPLDRP